MFLLGTRVGFSIRIKWAPHHLPMVHVSSLKEVSPGDILEVRAVDSTGCDTGDHCHCKKLHALSLEMDAQSLEVLSASLAGVLGSLIW